MKPRNPQPVNRYDHVRVVDLLPTTLQERLDSRVTFSEKMKSERETKQKIKEYLHAAGEEKINSITSNPEEAKVRFDRLYADPSDPIGEGKFNGWTPEDISSLYYVLFGEHLGEKIPLPPSHFEEDK